MKILGLTGSIATGKTFVADIFKRNNVKLFASDIEIGRLLTEQIVIEEIKKKKELALAITKTGEIDKKLLSDIVFNKLEYLKILEDILHPMIEKEIEEFIDKHKLEKIIILDIPLLFEKNYQSYCTKVITTFCNEVTQKKRALERNNLNKDKLDFIMRQQMPGRIKATLTDYLVYTDVSESFTTKQVNQILLKELE